MTKQTCKLRLIKLLTAFTLISSISHAADFTLEGSAGLGLPSFANYGLSIYHGPNKDIGIRFQTGNSTMSGEVGYTDKYEEFFFFVNRTQNENAWQKFVGLGIGRQDLILETNYTDKSGQKFSEKESFEKKYLKLNFAWTYFSQNHFTLGTDLSITYPLMISSKYEPGANIPVPQYSSYKSTQDQLAVFKTLLATGASLQFNIVRVGWYF